jgi:predicted NAD/FAD-binding protein
MLRLKIAIVGTGIAGNVVANRLAARHDITVFEANNYIGGHTNTVVVASESGNVPVDTGFIVYNDKTYPHFVSLLEELGIESHASTMSFSVQSERNALEYNGSTLNTLFAQRRNLVRPSFYRMIGDILRFNKEAAELAGDESSQLSLGDYLQRGRYGSEFLEQYLLPMGAAIWSADTEKMRQMPATFFARFLHNHGLLDLRNRPEWRVIKGGSRTYVSKLVAGHRHKIHLESPVEAITRYADRVRLKVQGTPAMHYDHVVLACHGDQALRLLQDASLDERQVLGAISYQKNEALLHTDESLMPKRKRAWAAWNCHIPATTNNKVTVTYHMNRLQRLTCSQQYFVTLNSSHRIRPETVLRTLHYEHPVFTAKSTAAQARYAEINGVNRTWFCGAYWRNGFHEDGVWSALETVSRIESGSRHEKRNIQRAS